MAEMTEAMLQSRMYQSLDQWWQRIRSNSGQLLGGSALAAIVVLTGCDPDGSGPMPPIQPMGMVGNEAEPAPAPPPPPPPDYKNVPCSEYDNLKAGRGKPEQQHWFNHAPARHGNKDYARFTLRCKYGGDDQQFQCLDKLWREENDGDDPSDGHDWHETNIPQAKPRSKMAAGPDDHRGQVDYGLWYIYPHRTDYADACEALRKWQARSPHWY